MVMSLSQLAGTRREASQEGARPFEKAQGAERDRPGCPGEDHAHGELLGEGRWAGR